MNKQKWRMRNYRPRIFLSFLAGKLKMFKLPITRVEPTEKTFQIVLEITFAYIWL